MFIIYIVGKCIISLLYTRNEKASHGQKIFTVHVSDKGLRSRIYKELLQIIKKNTDCTINKWAEDSNGHFTRKYPSGLYTYEKVFIMRYYHTPTEWQCDVTYPLRKTV